MAPNVNRKARAREAEQAARKLRALREHVEKTCEHVGERFPEEARRIHHGEVDKRDIYGEASLDEARALTEEGIEFGWLPFGPHHDS